jgi:ribulose-phosphate 3-epimerase
MKRNVEIIPAVNAETFKEVKDKIKLIEPYVKWAHLDIADGTFTKNTIWHNASDLANFETSLNIEAHLMVLNIERRLPEWLASGIKRIIFHIEATSDPDFVIKKLREANKEIGVSIAPDTPWMKLKPYFNKIDLLQVLSVYPGLAGQEFLEESIDKIRHLRENCPECIIEVDGGMKIGVAEKAIEAGADIIVAASAVFGKADVGKAIAELEDAVLAFSGKN